MNTYEVLLIARSEKRIPIPAKDEESALNLALDMYHYSDLIEFINEDVTDVDAVLAE